ncbi:MAG: S8 family serine peptidase, partial [Chloroflexota bacterium]|nr:S8 family serine peptidase [Chloroflexota bacterium]
MDLSETVPYIGAAAVQAAGFDGTGVRVAVLDSGIDYTHIAFGGAGTPDAYQAAYGTSLADARNRSRDGLFPTVKVIGGYDFVGESWPTGALAPDPDPIDCGSPPIAAPCDGGHGTHVADIIAGVHGVAPGAKLYAVKVCSAVSTSCSGVALIQAMDFAVDPNGDGSTRDHVDIVNMSLGSQYGQAPDDDLSFAVDVATKIGVLTVASAGNSGDKPYASGTPAAAKSALSVAQTAVPSSTGFVMLLSTDGGATFNPREAVFQSWSHPLTAAFAVTNVPVQYGDGAGGNLDGCVAFPAGSATGKVVLVDRGTCNFSVKIANIAAGNAKIGVIGLITPGDPFDGALGGCPSGLCAAIPGYMVSLATSNAMKGASARVTFDPSRTIPLVGHIVGSSSRGPSMVDNRLKPEIGAPGASVSAVVGSGNGTESFGGTSGAAPMVSGSAALLRDAFPRRSPSEIKALLMNTAETDIMNSPAVFGGRLAPISRIGGGEVRVDRA